MQILFATVFILVLGWAFVCAFKVTVDSSRDKRVPTFEAIAIEMLQPIFKGIAKLHRWLRSKADS